MIPDVLLPPFPHPSTLSYAIAACCWGAGGGASNLVFSAIILPNIIPTPSITPINTPQAIALLRIAFAPPRTARAAPVQNPPRIPFQGSSFFLPGRQGSGDVIVFDMGCVYLIPFTAQSNVENRPPHTPKLPPRTGARALMAVIAPMRRSPYGELLHACQSGKTHCEYVQDAIHAHTGSLSLHARLLHPRPTRLVSAMT